MFTHSVERALQVFDQKNAAKRLQLPKGGHEVDAQVQEGPKGHVGEGFALCIHIATDRKSLNSNS